MRIEIGPKVLARALGKALENGESFAEAAEKLLGRFQVSERSQQSGACEEGAPEPCECKQTTPADVAAEYAGGRPAEGDCRAEGDGEGGPTGEADIAITVNLDTASLAAGINQLLGNALAQAKRDLQEEIKDHNETLLALAKVDMDLKQARAQLQSHKDGWQETIRVNHRLAQERDAYKESLQIAIRQREAMQRQRDEARRLA